MRHTSTVLVHQPLNNYHSTQAEFFVLKVSIPLTVEITVANDGSIGGQPVDSDIIHGMSDGKRFVGFEAPDKGNYGNLAPCYGT